MIGTALKHVAFCTALVALYVIAEYGDDCQRGRMPWCDGIEYVLGGTQ